MAHARIIATLAALCVLVAAGHAGALIYNGLLDKNQMVATEQTIQIVRDLHLSHTIGFAVMTPDQVAIEFSKPRAGQPSDQVLSAEGRVGAMLGLFAKGTDLKAASVRMLRSQLLAFYDFRTKRMVVVDSAAASQAEAVLEQPGKRDLVGYMVLAHEFTHALQDQNFALGDKLDALRGDSDRELALRSVAEGDATLAGWGYAIGRMDQATVATLVGRLEHAAPAMAGAAGGQKFAEIQYFNFPYVDGARFVAEAYRRGGWPAVDALFANPPQSTQQIIHPSLYFDRPALPDRVTVAGYERLLPGWSVADGDTYGEIGLRVILQRNLGVKSPEILLARAWAGDRMVILRRGSDLAVAWLIAFRDAGSASRFATAYARVLDRIDGRITPHRIAARSSSVLVVAGVPARQAGLVPALWKASTITPAAAPAAHR